MLGKYLMQKQHLMIRYLGSNVQLADVYKRQGLIKAVNTFKRDKNIKLVTYASRCIENEILMFLRKKSRRKVEVSFDEPLNIDYDGNELLLSDILGTDDDIVTKEFEKQRCV